MLPVTEGTKLNRNLVFIIGWIYQKSYLCFLKEEPKIGYFYENGALNEFVEDKYKKKDGNIDARARIFQELLTQFYKIKKIGVYFEMRKSLNRFIEE